MKKILLLGLFSFSLAFAQTGIRISKSVYDGSKMEQLHHSGPGYYDTYLTMNLYHHPVKNLRTQMNFYLARFLKNRNEAHITVITPVEFQKNFKPYGVTIEQIDEVATKFKIQDSEFEIDCLGVGPAIVEGKEEKTYYIVVKSERLIEMRKAIQELLKEADRKQFNPLSYYPHITVGFTARDLHESDKVIKNAKSCEDTGFNLTVVDQL